MVIDITNTSINNFDVGNERADIIIKGSRSLSQNFVVNHLNSSVPTYLIDTTNPLIFNFKGDISLNGHHFLLLGNSIPQNKIYGRIKATYNGSTWDLDYDLDKRILVLDIDFTNDAILTIPNIGGDFMIDEYFYSITEDLSVDDGIIGIQSNSSPTSAVPIYVFVGSRQTTLNAPIYGSNFQYLNKQSRATYNVVNGFNCFNVTKYKPTPNGRVLLTLIVKNI